MPLQQLIQTYLPAIENELQLAVARSHAPHYAELLKMMRYHMGWEGEGAGSKATGKRVRPLLVLLTAAAAGGNWKNTLPAAAAVELVHNFSLVHDDIEDNSPLRRGRPTVWKIWGLSQGINTGDTLFTLAHLEMLELRRSVSTKIVLDAASLLQQTCLHLTQGQFLDISYENRNDLVLSDYWPMVSGKTAALLEACTELGAIVAESDAATRNSYRLFGRDLGLAFQALDDYLGIWGDVSETGKSAASDLLEGKKSLPVLFGLQQNGAFAARWRQGPISPEEVPTLAAQLATEGGQAYTQQQAERLTQQALDALEAANPLGDAGEALVELANILLKREV
ncbi:MAG: polyprenyl synthetase family protein [Chloroflexi bacterium]|jgi:geranylgeranyl diphosphate synthase, type I|nr:polyprenyl synthetase family protein [Chloroflexota bacterium]